MESLAIKNLILESLDKIPSSLIIKLIDFAISKS